MGLDVARCRHCGGAPGVDPGTAARLDALRAAAQRTAPKAQQLDGELAAFGEGVGLLEVGTAALLWGFIGGFLTLGAAGNLEEGETFVGVLVDPPSGAAELAFSSVTFWMTLVTVTGFATCCVLAGAARLLARRQVRFTYPAPPAVPGGAPGCRVCGDDLQGRAAIRRCRACGADHVVDGVHFQHVTDTLDARLRARERATASTLESRQRLVRRVEKLVLGPPFAVLVLCPVVFWFGLPHAMWWALPGGLFGLATLLFGLAALLPAPAARGR